MPPPSADTAEPYRVIRDALACSAPFGEWDKADQDKLARSARLVHYERRRTLRTPRGPFHDLFVIASGCLEVQRGNARGETFVLQLAPPGIVLGLTLLLPDPQSQYTVLAREDSWVVHVPCSDLRQLLDSRPLLWRSIAMLSMASHRSDLKDIGQYVLDDLPMQVAAALVRAMGAPTLPVIEAKSLAINQADLASMLGLSRQTINRGLKDLTDQGLIDVGYRNIEIRDLNRLRHMAGALELRSPAGLNSF